MTTLRAILAGEVREFVLVPAPDQPPEHSPWPEVAAGAVALAVAAAVALIRARRPQGPSPRRVHRIAAASAAFGLALSLLLTVLEAKYGASAWGADKSDLELAFGFAMGAVVFSIFGGLMLMTADLLLDPLRPHRTRFWLVLAPPLLAGFVLGLLAATGWEDTVLPGPGPGWASLAVAASAAAIVWWSFLPRPGDDVAWIFS